MAENKDQEQSSDQSSNSSLSANSSPLFDQLVCDVCLEANLTTDVNIQACSTCGENFCIHGASHIDPAHCKECAGSITVTISEISKTTHFENHDTGEQRTRTRRARQINIGGMHWLFAQRTVPSMTDAELSAAIEYHRTFLEFLVNERELRRMATFRRNAKTPYTVKSSSSIPAPGSTQRVVTKTTTTKTTKTRSKAKAKTSAASSNPMDLADLLKALLSTGLSKDQILNSIKGGK